MCGMDDGIDLSEEGRVADGVIDRIPFFLVPGRAKEIEQRKALALDTAVDRRFVRGVGNDRHTHAAGAKRLTQVGALQVLVDVFDRAEEEHPVALDRTAERAAELL